MKQRSSIEVKVADLSYLQDIAEIERACFKKPWEEKCIEESLKDKKTSFLVAKIDGKIIGYIGFYIVVDEAYIYNIAVYKEYRNNGAGQLLLQNAEKVAKNNGAEFISLEVRCSNLSAIGLYKKKGFKSVGVRKRFYTMPVEDAVIMTKYFD